MAYIENKPIGLLLTALLLSTGCGAEPQDDDDFNSQGETDDAGRGFGPNADVGGNPGLPEGESEGQDDAAAQQDEASTEDDAVNEEGEDTVTGNDNPSGQDTGDSAAADDEASAAADDDGEDSAAADDDGEDSAAADDDGENSAAADDEATEIDPRCVRFKSSAGEEVITDSFTSGTAGSPYLWTATESGMLEICPGEFFVQLECAGSEDNPIQIDIVGAAKQTTTLSTGNAGPVITIEGCTGSFRNFTVTGNSNGESGGAAFFQPGEDRDFRIEEIDFVDNRSSGSGGAASTGSGRVAFTSVHFFGNSALEGGALASSGTELRLTDVEFADNIALAGRGGALAISGGLSTLTDVIATGNMAPTFGGAMDFANSVVAIQNTTLDSNTADSDGGALSFLGGSARLLDLRCYGNTTPTFGGCVSFDGTSAELQNSTFQGNNAGTDGGAMVLNNGATLSNLDVRWLGNSADNWGGAVAGDASTVYSGQNCDFVGNTPDNVYWDDSFTYSGWGENVFFSCSGPDCDPCAEHTLYRDVDEDGFGDPLDTMEGCGPPEGYVEVAGDCDDADASLYPGQLDLCDGVDTDCDGAVDEDTINYYDDADGDGFGSGAESCLPASDDAPVNSSTVDGDCDDSDSSSFPGASESCDGSDNDCDASIDEGAVCPTPTP